MRPECREALAKVSAYLDGDLEKADCEMIEQHGAACAACATVVEELRQAVGLCRQVGVAPLPSVVLERARARMRRLLEEPAKADE